MYCCITPTPPTHNWCRFHVPSVYTGSAAAGPFGSASRVLEPVYWFVDLLAPFHVTNVVFTAGGDMSNASIYVGSDPASVFGNTRVAVGGAAGAVARGASQEPGGAAAGSTAPRVPSAAAARAAAAVPVRVHLAGRFACQLLLRGRSPPDTPAARAQPRGGPAAGSGRRRHAGPLRHHLRRYRLRGQH